MRGAECHLRFRHRPDDRPDHQWTVVRRGRVSVIHQLWSLRRERRRAWWSAVHQYASLGAVPDHAEPHEPRGLSRRAHVPHAVPRHVPQPGHRHEFLGCAHYRSGSPSRAAAGPREARTDPRTDPAIGRRPRPARDRSVLRQGSHQRRPRARAHPVVMTGDEIMTRIPRWATVAISLLVASCGKDSVGPAPVDSLTVTPATYTVHVGETVQLVATVKDEAGNVLTDRAVAWLSSNPAVATVSPTGLVTGVLADPAITISATSEHVTGSAAITVTTPTPAGPLTFVTVETGAYHTCARTAAGAAYCWGYNAWAQFGDGTKFDANAPQAAAGGLAFASISVG